MGPDGLRDWLWAKRTLAVLLAKLVAQIRAGRPL
jgi:hypothetical protein